MTSLEKEFAPYQESLELKELGFDEPCFGYYEPNKEFNYINWEVFKDFPYLAKNSEWQDLYGAPTFSQAFRWFREKHNLHVNKTGNNFYTSFNIVEPDLVVLSFERYTDTENHYEEAELACLKKLIEIVKNG